MAVKQPKALKLFFATEMWERYGFYVIQTLLAIYLLKQFELADTLIDSLVGSFTAFTYISPIIGGWLADHYLGQKRAILLGGVILSLAYSLLAFSHTLAEVTYCLAGVAVGTGLFKPNISGLLGTLYKQKAAARDSGFTLFYVGISTGIILGSAIPGILMAHYGWPSAYLSASLGLLFAILTFALGSSYYHIQDIQKLTLSYRSYGVTFLILILSFLAYTAVIRLEWLSNITFFVIAIATIGVTIQIAFKYQGYQRRCFLAFLLLCGVSVVFWSLYFQMFLSLTLFIIRLVKSELFGLVILPPYYITVESIGLVVLGPILAKFWQLMHAKNRPVSSEVKFALSMTFTTLAFLSILLLTKFSASFPISAMYLMAIYLLISLAELLISPIGLALVTKLIPKGYVGLMIGVFFVSLGLGAKVAGWMADFAALSPTVNYSLPEIRMHYLHAFTIFLLISFAATLIAWLLVPLLRRLMQKP